MSESNPIKTEIMDIVKEPSCEQLEETETKDKTGTENETKDKTVTENETKDKTMEVVELPTTSAANVDGRQVLSIDFIESIKGNTAMINKIIQESTRRRRKRKRDKRKSKIKVKRVKAEALSGDTLPEAGLSGHKKETHTYTYSSSSDDEVYSITVSNLPNTWTYLEIKNYLDQQCGHVDEIEMLKIDNSNKYGAIRLTFQSSNECLQAMKKLYNKEVEGCQLTVKMNDTDNGSDSDSNITEDLANMKPWRPDLDPWDIDPSGLYGLKLQFLTSLNITPPLDKWVQVSNFRCDKSELRDVMELAGHVLLCSVLTVSGKYAKVMYNHPLEAVQAVSMLNGQTFYGKSLKVIMDKSPNEAIILPKGLSSVGQGLGEKGKPVRNIAKHYKRYANQQTSLINSLLFEKVAIENNTTMEDVVTDDANVKKDGGITKKPFKVLNVSELNNYGVSQEKDDGASDNSADEAGVNVASPNPGKPNETRKLATHNPPVPNAPKISSNINVPDKNIRPQFGPVVPVGAGHALLPNPSFNQMGPRPTFGPNNFQRPYFPNPAVLPMSPGNYAPGPRPFIGPMPHPNGHPRQPLNLSGPRQPMPLNGPPRPPMNPIGLPRHPMKPLNLSGPQVPGRLPDPMLMGAPMPRPFSPQMSNNTGSCTVEMCNLPPSTTFPLLCDKLSHCGQVVSLQFTTPGCAVVVFSQRSHAEMCYQKFNRFTVDGYMIEVKYR